MCVSDCVTRVSQQARPAVIPQHPECTAVGRLESVNKTYGKRIENVTRAACLTKCVSNPEPGPAKCPI
eukprot:4563566-Heterocapsa_arctica.AAC.1